MIQDHEYWLIIGYVLGRAEEKGELKQFAYRKAVMDIKEIIKNIIRAMPEPMMREEKKKLPKW